MTGPDLRQGERRRAVLLGPALLAAAVSVAIAVSARGIGDEGAVWPLGDMPRYMMDGVFLYDFLGSSTAWSPDAVWHYAERYYARYPALSLGHHPPLLPLSLLPFYAMFGVSVFAARVAIVGYFVLSVVLCYTLVRRLYHAEAAGWAALLFASSPGVAPFAQVVLSELPTMALVLGALNALVRVRALRRRRDFVAFAIIALASLLMRQLAVLMFPAYVAVLMDGGGWTRLSKGQVTRLLSVGVLLGALAVTMATFSPFNVAVVRQVFAGSSVFSRWHVVLSPVVHAGLVPVLGPLAAAGLLTAIVERDRRILTGLYWITCVLAGVLFVTGAVEPGRYSILAVPAYCLCAASLVGPDRSRGIRAGLTLALAVGVLCQIWWARGTRPPSAGGYEEAARFVLAHSGPRPAPTVLYSASIDTGHFIFFMRKHDPAGRVAILRADKLLTTSLMGQLSVEDRIASPAQIYPLLERYGTRFVVLEDRPSGSLVLDWLRDEVRGSRFTERVRLPIAGEGATLGTLSLAIYEFKGAQPPEGDAVIDIKTPLVGREIRVPLSDVVPVSVQGSGAPARAR